MAWYNLYYRLELIFNILLTQTNDQALELSVVSQELTLVEEVTLMCRKLRLATQNQSSPLCVTPHILIIRYGPYHMVHIIRWFILYIYTIIYMVHTFFPNFEIL